MNVQLGNLAVGKWRYFTLPEIDKMNQLVAESSKTGEVAVKKVKVSAPKPEALKSIEPKKKTVPEKKAPVADPDKKPKKKSTYAEFRSKRWR